MNVWVKRIDHPKQNFCHDLLALMPFQACTFFLLWKAKGEFLKKLLATVLFNIKKVNEDWAKLPSSKITQKKREGKGY